MKIRICLLVALISLAVNALAAGPGSGAPVPFPPLLPGAAAPPMFDPSVIQETTIPDPPPAPAAAPAPASGGFLVKFNNADIYEVIHTLGRIAGINYLIDPRVKGVVNVHTQGMMQKDAALELLYSILKINGATAVREADLYHIIPMAEAKMEPLPVPAPGARGASGLPNLPVMRAFPLQYIAASEMAKVIKPFLSTGGEAVEVTRANMLLVIDTSGNMEKHARLVELFDADAFRSAGVRLFPLQFLDPEEMAKNLDAIFGALDFSAKGGRPAGINFVSLSRMNALLVVSASPKTLDDVARWIGELDKPASGVSRGVHLYRVRHGKVADLAGILEKLYPGKASPVAGKSTEFKPSLGDGQSRTAQPMPGVTVQTKASEPLKAYASPSPGKEGDSERFDIIPDEPINALIIRGSASEYAALLEVLKTIDVYPRQVLLEVLIGEVQLDDALRMGVDWTYLGKLGTSNITSALSTSAADIGTPGFKYMVDKTDRLTAAFHALASDGKVSILSSPSVLAANGKKSKIMVADQIPVTTASIVANSNPPVTTSTVEYKDAGIILSFTPYINDQGIVTLEIDQEVSDISTTVSSTTSNPVFFKRNIQTTLIATEDRSIVLGGLVKERKSRGRDGLPFLYKIPFLGWLFGARADSTNRTELLIFITPRVIASVEDGTKMSREFEERVQELKQQIGEAKGMKRESKEAPAPPSAK